MIRKRRRKKMLVGTVLAVLTATLVTFIAFKYFSFPKQPKRKVERFLGQAVGIFAHRGGRPENTLAAMRVSHQQGAIGIEVDLAFTKDGKSVLIHDYKVDRTSDESGMVSDFTLAQLKTFDFGSKTGGQSHAGESIPTLQEAVELCKELDLLMFLELKEKATKSAEVVRELFARDPSLYSRIAVISFYPHILYKVRQVNPDVLVGLVCRNNVLSTFPNGLPRDLGWWEYFVAVLMDKILIVSMRTWLWRMLGLSLLVGNKDDIMTNRLDLEMWKKRDVQVVAWTVNSVQEKIHFRDVLKIPFMSDNVDWEVSVSEQSV